MRRHCFTYGSLMCADIMAAVCGVEPAGEPATLADHRRHPVRGEAYPGMVPAAGAEVSGVLYRHLPPDALARLDAFEGPQYVRVTVRVRLPDGAAVEADTYMFRPEHADELLPGEWDFDRFLREGKARFQHQYMNSHCR
ncbi:putative AIG2-like protein [Azoarcus olearius]|uniref:gamma-glutamylcyclotransferase family protein n=1 Tax=Azoarcus sp. (strain BH72) TaxID=418699 RepID=UPI0008062905|nr:gamma-glutamylcyclotransferase family protein [Azoarcus olearius]ANQ86015.1 putative AIG2-like protein [Azoarcus olearius]